KKEAIGNGPPTPPPLPEEFKKTIQEIGSGKNISEEAEMKLVIQKGLFETDLAAGNNRLSIPFTRVRDHGFLTEEEARFLTTRDRNNKMKFKDVTIIEPSLRREKVKLSRWDMKKGNGKNTCSSYVINGKWRHIVERNRLEPGDVVQLWSFRIDQELHFALVKLPDSIRPHVPYACEALSGSNGVSQILENIKPTTPSTMIGNVTRGDVLEPEPNDNIVLVPLSLSAEKQRIVIGVFVSDMI
ncbi:hypothetical protein MIMGU_mgv1a022380mg, partial [Erythranthe guttata]